MIIAISEPLGARRAQAPLSIGGEGADLVLPGVEAGAQWQIASEEGLWRVVPLTDAGSARVNGQRLREAHDLRPGDVISAGAAQLVVRALPEDGAPLALEVAHLAGNDTIAPIAQEVATDHAYEDEDVEIVPGVVRGDAPARAKARRGTPLAAKVMAAVLAFVTLAAVAWLALIERVPLEIEPAGAKVETVGSLVGWQSGATLFVLPGKYRLRALAEGYVPAEKSIEVTREPSAAVRFRLEKQPGVLVLDTGGVEADVFVDGAAVGRVPGEVKVPAGQRTLTVRAERHLDAIVPVEVEGLGKRQDVKVALQPSWGVLAVTVNTPNARMTVDGKDLGAVQARLDLPAGVHQLKISAEGAKSWESAIVIKAGETAQVGPIDLGAPDARLLVRSTPAGADVTVDGTYRGRTPLEIGVSPGAQHDVLVARTGHESWTRSFSAASGERTILTAALTPILVPLSVLGEPADAEVLIDGEVKGRTPLELKVLAGNHSLEVRKPGLAPFTTRVTIAPGLARTVNYTLTEPGRPSSALAAGTQGSTKSGIAMKLIKPATFEVGSERREQGRKPNEVKRTVTLTRPFYIGVTEVTNAQFRKFRPDHASGYVDKRSVDLDAQPVVQVDWKDAVEFCNWLSAQEGLPAAYVKKDATWVLASPVNNGFRLPTEAEWEYAARWSGTHMQRYPWGDALPIGPASGNYGGIEAQGTMTPVLEAYRDDFPSAAPVGRFPANALGLRDMAGNVSEWVHDFYASLPAAAPQTDPFGPAEGTRHAVRGSNWRTAQVSELRYAARDGADSGNQAIGFRVARYADP